MSAYSVDGENYPTRIRQRNTADFVSSILGLKIQGTASDLGWYRLCPDGIMGSRNGSNVFTLANLRADVDGLDFRDWVLIVANLGFEQDRDIVKTEGNVVTVSTMFNLLESLPESGLRYVLMPSLLNDLNVVFAEGSEGMLELAHTAQFLEPGGVGYSREEISGNVVSPVLKLFGTYEPGENVEIPIRDIRNLFYRFSDASDDNEIFWGEIGLL